MTFQLDTTGGVCAPIIDGAPRWPSPVLNVGEPKRWPDLDAFTQGYVEALFDSLCPEEDGSRPLRQPRFSDLAPETLARIITDCASFQNIARGLGQKTGAVEGRHFWNGQQRGLGGAFGAAFPPLTVQLGDDGKVRFA